MRGSIRFQVIAVTVFSILVLSVILVTFDFSRKSVVLVDSERRVGLTLIRSVNNTINSVRKFITTLRDISEMDTRLAELVNINSSIDFITITDSAGEVIFHSDQQYDGKLRAELADLPADMTFLKDVAGYGEVYLTSQTFESGGLVETSAFQIVVASAVEPIRNQLVSDVLSSILVTLLFALAAALVIILLLQHYFLRPLTALSAASEAIEAGDLSQRVVIHQHNELGQLAMRFNSMTQQLATLINELEAHVRERTYQLEIARDQAEQASRAKSDFLSNMSHELRTPLNMVIGYTSSMLNMPQMYNNVPLPDVYRRDVQLVQDGGKHLLTLINDILDLSKVEAGKLTLNFSAVDLHETFEDAVAVSLGLIGNKPIQLRKNYPAEMPFVRADKIRVRQILLNLLSNAVKFTESGSVTLSADVQGQVVRIAVADTGPGIPQSALKTIFDRFEQIQEKRQILGTGLGLDISQRLARLHDTEITVESVVGRGSLFAFALPIVTADQNLPYGIEAGGSYSNIEVFSQNMALQASCLVVTSDSTIRQQMRQALEKRGMSVVAADDYQHAVDIASGILPDFIFLDLALHDRDIQEILNSLASDPDTQDIPIILIGDSTDRGNIGSTSIKATVTRPIVAEAVFAIIQTLSTAERPRELSDVIAQ